MKIEYFFPVFKEDKIEEILLDFKKSKFFENNKDYEMFFVCEKEDKENLNYLLTLEKKEKKNKIIILDKPFTYNDAFYYALPKFKADIVLLGDTKISRNDIVFEKCLEKYLKKASVVHVIKKHRGFKGFWVNMARDVYNFFVKIFTGKRDRCNVISLGLIDKNIINLLQVLPYKSMFLKNTKDLHGFETRSIYIDPKTNTYKNNYKRKTGYLIATYVSAGAFGALLISQILLNIFLTGSLSAYNIINVFLLFLSLISTSIVFPKHIFDIRNRENRKEKYQTKYISFEEEVKKVEEKETKKTKVLKNKKTTAKAKNTTKKPKKETRKTKSVKTTAKAGK